MPFLEIEVNGASNVIKVFGKENVVSVFLAPPSVEELRERIVARGTESVDQINERIARVNEEMRHKDRFDFVVVNDSLENAVEKIKAILKDIR